MKFYTILFLILSNGIFAQVDKQSELFLQIEKMDQQVFGEGFNNCNIAALEKITASDLEFYHDIGGIQNKEEFIKAMRMNICGDPNRHLTRQVVENSVDVFPLHKDNKLYGAFQTGEHLFYAQDSGQPIQITGYAKFSMLWILEDEEWKLKRVISYDHEAR